jgi:hypothetical protein
VKPAARAAEKAARHYGGDASRLLDCCRARAVLDDAAGVAALAAAAARDPEVEVVGVRNRLDPAVDAAPAGGFR